MGMVEFWNHSPTNGKRDIGLNNPKMSERKKKKEVEKNKKKLK